MGGGRQLLTFLSNLRDTLVSECLDSENSVVCDISIHLSIHRSIHSSQWPFYLAQNTQSLSFTSEIRMTIKWWMKVWLILVMGSHRPYTCILWAASSNTLAYLHTTRRCYLRQTFWQGVTVTRDRGAHRCLVFMRLWSTHQQVLGCTWHTMLLPSGSFPCQSLHFCVNSILCSAVCFPLSPGEWAPENLFGNWVNCDKICKISCLEREKEPLAHACSGFGKWRFGPIALGLWQRRRMWQWRLHTSWLLETMQEVSGVWPVLLSGSCPPVTWLLPAELYDLGILLPPSSATSLETDTWTLGALPLPWCWCWWYVCICVSVYTSTRTHGSCFTCCKTWGAWDPPTFWDREEWPPRIFCP